MIKAMFIAQIRSQQQQPVNEVKVVAKTGIVGDRYFGKNEYPGQNLTLVEIEEIERYNADYGQSISLEDTRRNIITRGVCLNELVGKEFRIGEVTLRGVELCEPCATLGKVLENDKIDAAGIVKALTNKGGLRADIVVGGILSVGMTF